MIGSLLNNRYRIDSELGQGGMGVIYRAHDTLLGRDVAIKVVSYTKLGTEGRARLLREAQATAQLNHPNIVSVYDAGEADGVPFIVMELVSGDSLFERRPSNLSEVIDVARQICTALEHAHAHGIVHRDLKPENVLITTEGVVKLTDFGLARSLASRISTDGTIVGTVFYVAPEAALGQPVDGRADLYALGVMLYEMTTGHLPFVADEPLAVISQHLHTPVVPPRIHNTDIPPALDVLIVWLLSKRPEDRPASAGEVRSALEVLSRPGVLAGSDGGALLLRRIVHGRLVGRERELAEMTRLWERAAAGEGYVLLISGEPGIGKTRLVREMVALAQVTQATALSAECYAEGGAPYAAIAQLIREVFAGPRGAGLELPDFVLADLVTLAPDLRARFPTLPPNPSLDPQAEQQRLFESVVLLCNALSTRTPLLLSVDDVHWADSSSLSLLRHLARRARAMPVLIALTYRETALDEAGPLQSVLVDLNRERLATRIKLTRLDREQTCAMLDGMLMPSGEIDAGLVDAIYRGTEGNPFFIEEVCKALIEEDRLCYEDGRWVAGDITEMGVPQSVRVAVQTRLTRLPVAAQEVLRMAAILGREFDFETLRHAVDMDEETLIVALESAERAQVIEEVRYGRAGVPTFAFAHALVPSTLRDGLSTLRRQRLHRRVADAVLAVHPDDWETLAYHCENGGDADCARKYYLQAGEHALAVYANQEAECDFRAALELSQSDADRAPLLAGLGEALLREGSYGEAVQTWQQGVALYGLLGDPDPVARLYARAARAAWYAGDPPRGLALCREGMAAVPLESETPGIATLLHETARACFFNGLPDEALQLCQRALALARKLGLVEVQADTLATLGLLPNQPREAAQQALEQAVELAESAGLLAIAIRAHTNLGTHLHGRGDLLSARTHYARSKDLARRMGVVSWEYTSLVGETNITLDLGDFAAVDEALQIMRQSLNDNPNASLAKFYLDVLKSTLLWRRGEWEEAIRLWRVCEAEAPVEEAKAPGLKTNLGWILFESGRMDEAADVLSEAITLLHDRPSGIDDETLLMSFSLLSGVRIRQGRLEEARRLFEQAEGRVKPHATLVSRLWLLAAEGRLAAAEQRWPQMLAAYKSFCEGLRGAGLRWHLARGLSEWAEVLLARGEAGDPERAGELLRESLAIFEQIGAPGYVKRVEELLREA